jgi:hypothetical protein
MWVDKDTDINWVVVSVASATFGYPIRDDYHPS